MKSERLNWIWFQPELPKEGTLVQAHGHGADEGFDPGCGLVVGGPESSSHVFVIEDLHFEREILFELRLWKILHF